MANSGPERRGFASHLPVHSLAYCFLAAKRKCFQEEVNVFAEYGVLNYWTYRWGDFYRSGTGAEYVFVLKNSVGRGKIYLCRMRRVYRRCDINVSGAGVATLIKNNAGSVYHCSPSRRVLSAHLAQNPLRYADLKGARRSKR